MTILSGVKAKTLPTLSRCISGRSFLARKIDADNIIAVLADGWHDVAESSFYLDDYEFHRKQWASQPTADAAPAASWKDSNGYRISCPLAAILAVRFKPQVALGVVQNLWTASGSAALTAA